jgi:hypothetical protein
MRRFFLDPMHPSALVHRVCAEAIAKANFSGEVVCRTGCAMKPLGFLFYLSEFWYFSATANCPGSARLLLLLLLSLFIFSPKARRIALPIHAVLIGCWNQVAAEAGKGEIRSGMTNSPDRKSSGGVGTQEYFVARGSRPA